MPIDVNRGTNDISLPNEVSSEIWASMQEASAVQQLARQITLPGAGAKIPVIASDPEAEWTDETDHKPVKRPTFGSVTIEGHTLAVIVPFSNQFKRDLPALYSECVRRLPGALAKKFDATVFGTGSGLANFAELGTATIVDISPGSTVDMNTYAGLVEAYTTVAGNGGSLNGWVFDASGKGLLLGQVDTTGRPLLLESIQSGNSVPQILGEPVVYSKGAGSGSVVGYAGDWSTAVWGSVEGVNISISENTIEDGTTTVKDGGGNDIELPNVVSLWGRNMFAVRAEIEIGFQVQNVNRFVRLRDVVRSA